VGGPAQGAEGDSAAVLRRAAQFAADVLGPAALTVDSSHQLPPAHLDLLAARGFYGMAGPREHGGLEVDFPTTCRVVEVLAGACLSTTFVWMQHHGAVRAVAAATDSRLRGEWLKPLCLGQRRAGVALAGTLPGPALLQARPVTNGYALDGVSPWVTGWGLIDTLYTAARDEHDNIVWGLLDAQPGTTLSAEPLQMVAVMASHTVQVRFTGHFLPAGRVTGVMPLTEWRNRDADGLRVNGSLALGIAARCCHLAGPSPLDDELASCRAALDAGTSETMPAARAAASELAMRAAAALVVAQGSKAILLDQDAQRLAREALFLLVFGSRPPIKKSLSGILEDPHGAVHGGRSGSCRRAGHLDPA
jgi:alkylation response protein AidB-like acyl-CoA dehydrogenase